MANYEVTTDKGTYQIDTEAAPQAEIPAAAVPSASATPNPSFLPNYKSVMDKIGTRPSMVKDLINDPSTLDRFMKHPVGTTLRTIGGAAEYAEGVPALIGMAIQKGDFSDLPDKLVSLAQGKNPAQLGDVVRNTGFGGSANESISSTVGLLSSFANPPGMKSAKALDAITVKPAVSKLGEFIDPSAQSLINKAQKLTTEILQPSKGELANSLGRGRQLPAIEQAAKVISKSKDYEELGQNLDTSIKDIFDKRNAILSSNNYKIPADYMKPLEDLIAKKQAGGQMTESELGQMNDVLSREKAFFVKNGATFDRLNGQGRKEFLQDATQSLLTKLSNGDVIDTQPFRTQALNALRTGLKVAVEGGDKKVAAYNETYGGLKRAKELVAGQQALDQKAVSEHAIDRITRMLNPSDIPTAVARSAALRAKSLSSRTGQIEQLMNRAKSRSLRP